VGSALASPPQSGVSGSLGGNKYCGAWTIVLVSSLLPSAPQPLSRGCQKVLGHTGSNAVKRNKKGGTTLHTTRASSCVVIVIVLTLLAQLLLPHARPCTAAVSGQQQRRQRSSRAQPGAPELERLGSNAAHLALTSLSRKFFRKLWRLAQVRKFLFIVGVNA
jgi:hypothetical protein